MGVISCLFRMLGDDGYPVLFTIEAMETAMLSNSPPPARAKKVASKVMTPVRDLPSFDFYDDDDGGGISGLGDVC